MRELLGGLELLLMSRILNVRNGGVFKDSNINSDEVYYRLDYSTKKKELNEVVNGADY